MVMSAGAQARRKNGPKPALVDVALRIIHSTKAKDTMKKLTVLLLGCLLAVSFAPAGEPSAADQKWIQAVKNMVTKGEKKVATPNEGRVALLKEWALKKGYAVKVTKTDAGFTIEVSGKEDGKTVAQK